MHFLIPYSFGAAARFNFNPTTCQHNNVIYIFDLLNTKEMLCCSTRISNELGAGKPKAAQLVLSAVLVLSIVEFVIASTVIFCCRYILGYIFSNEKSVVYYVKDMTFLLCVSIVMDSLQAVLSGDFS